MKNKYSNKIINLLEELHVNIKRLFFLEILSLQIYEGAHVYKKYMLYVTRFAYDLIISNNILKYYIWILTKN